MRSNARIFPTLNVAPLPAVELASEASLPTEFGAFRVAVFKSGLDGKEHVALYRGRLQGAEGVPTRLHSECLTGDVLGSLRCDCRAQLERALRTLGGLPTGLLLYLRQEGRGIGLANKIRAYGLQEAGLDTVDANLALGFRDDERDYGVAAAIIEQLGIRSIELMTNNPDKLRQLSDRGVHVRRRLPHAIPPNPHNRRYLETKLRRAGHLLEPEEGADESNS
ncbi:MAG: GTP cyclohydrolase II [Myxococcota bacterium]